MLCCGCHDGSAERCGHLTFSAVRGRQCKWQNCRHDTHWIMDPAFREEIVGESMFVELFSPANSWPSLPDVSAGHVGSTAPFLSHSMHVAMSVWEHDGSWMGDSEIEEVGMGKKGGKLRGIDKKRGTDVREA
jgi:hypothetical protein